MSNLDENNLNLSDPIVLDTAPTHHVYCENGVCKIDVSHNDDEKFNLFLSKSRSFYEWVLSSAVKNIKNNSNLMSYLELFNEDSSYYNLYVLSLKSYSTVLQKYLSSINFSKNSLKCYIMDMFDTIYECEDESNDECEDKCEHVEVVPTNDESSDDEEMFDNNFMNTIKLFAESQKNFSEILNKQSKFLDSKESTSDCEDMEEESVDEDTEEDYQSDKDDSDTENEEDDNDSSLLSVVRYFAQSQSNFSKSLYYFMNYE